MEFFKLEIGAEMEKMQKTALAVQQRYNFRHSSCPHTVSRTQWSMQCENQHWHEANNRGSMKKQHPVNAQDKIYIQQTSQDKKSCLQYKSSTPPTINYPKQLKVGEDSIKHKQQEQKHRGKATVTPAPLLMKRASAVNKKYTPSSKCSRQDIYSANQESNKHMQQEHKYRGRATVTPIPLWMK